jgi:hypothetical protein
MKTIISLGRKIMYSADIQHIPANDKRILAAFKKFRQTFTELVATLHKAQTAANLAGTILQNKEKILKIYVK